MPLRKQKEWLIALEPLLALEDYRGWPINPFSGELWRIAPVTEAEVHDALLTQALDDRSWQTVRSRLPEGKYVRDYHIRRIAYLVKNMAADPIELALIATDQRWIPSVLDGSHRLAALVIRGQRRARTRLYTTAHDEEVLAILPGSSQVKQL